MPDWVLTVLVIGVLVGVLGVTWAKMMKINNTLLRVQILLSRMEANDVTDRGTMGRIEAEGERVAVELEDTQGRATVVAEDPESEAGAAADVAASSPPGGGRNGR